MKLLDCFKSLSYIQVQIGQSCFFWADKWNQQPLSSEYPQLFSFAKNKYITVSKFFALQQPQIAFNLPLSAEAFEQLQLIQSFVEHFPLTDQKDN